MARRRHEEEEAGEGYFASISDLMVGILFVFLLMLAVFAINFADADKDKEIAELREELRALKPELAQITAERDYSTLAWFEMLNILRKLADELRGLQIRLVEEQGRGERVRSELLDALQASIRQRGVLVEVDMAQGVLRLSSDALFENNEDRFTAEGERNALVLIEEVGSKLLCPGPSVGQVVACERYRDLFETILVEGHSDTNPTSRRGGNWRLSMDRASAFFDFMKGNDQGFVGLRNALGQPLIGLAAYGDTRTRPDMPGADARNRRIEVRFLLAARPNTGSSAEIEWFGPAIRDLLPYLGGRP